MSVTHRSEGTQDAVTIVHASTPRQVKQFVEFPFELYGNDPHWIPELRRDARRRLSATHNPFLAHAEIALFLAVADRKTVGRIAGIEDHGHNAYHHERLAWFGFFEARDARVAASLLTAVEQWGAARGCTAVRGPANPSLNESAGLLVRGFDDDPYLLMPYNPPEYAAFVEAAGYRKAKDLLAWDVDLTQPLGPRIEKLADRVRRRNDIQVRRVEMKHFDRDLALMQAIYRSAWEDNWGFVPPTDEEMRQLAMDLKPVIDPDMVLFAELGRRAVATVVVLPDVNQVLKRMNGRLLPFGLWHFLNRKKIIDRCRLVLLGVMAEHRNLGVYPLLISEIHRRGVANGYIRGECSWTLEDNHAINAGLEASGARQYKTYRLYEKPIR